MEETQPQTTIDRQPVGTIPGRNNSRKKWFILVVFILILLGVAAFFFLRSPQEQTADRDVSSESTPLSEVQEEPTPIPTPTPEPERGEISIEVLNGTGIAGEAAFLRDKLVAVGYSDIEVGNAKGEAQETTEVGFASDVATIVRDEVLQLLEQTYSDVETTTSVSDVDVRITTGLRKGQSLPTPTPTKTPATTPTPAATDSATP